MLKSLKIKNYAIIQNVEIAFDDQLNIITGETGAGKSILMGALSLVMGQRADTTVLYEAQTKCIVEARFENYPDKVDLFLEENDFDKEESLIIRREISVNGKSRAFINDTPTRLTELQGLSSMLIDLNSQFEVTAIHNATFQLNMVDAWAGTTAEVLDYKSGYDVLRKLKKEFEALRSKESSQLKEYDFLDFQLQELIKAELLEGEQSELEAEQKLLEKSEWLKNLSEETKYGLEESDNSIKDSLGGLLYKWQDYAELRPEIQQLVEHFNNVLNEIDDIDRLADDILNKMDADPARLDEISERLSLIYNLQRKHQVNSVEELLQLQGEMTEKLFSFNSDKDRLSELERLIQKQEAGLMKEAEALSQKRSKVFASLEKEVNNRLTELAMPSAEIKIDNDKSGELGVNGLDRIEFLFRANVGSQLQSVGKVASGGESARLMLALKSSVAEMMELPTLIFDEIDSGVSGEVAGRMGNMLKKLAASHQLICITHSPQVASRADRHYFVFKAEEANRTVTHVKNLDTQERITEIAKMLSGDPPSAHALENARELMSN